MSEVKIREAEMRIERLEEHKKMMMERINDIDGTLLALNGTLIRIETTLKGLPDKISALEAESNKREGYISSVKIITGILIGVLITYAINNLILAQKDESHYEHVISSK